MPDSKRISYINENKNESVDWKKKLGWRKKNLFLEENA